MIRETPTEPSGSLDVGKGNADASDGFKTQELLGSLSDLVEPMSQPMSMSQSQSQSQSQSGRDTAEMGTEQDHDLPQRLLVERSASAGTEMLESGNNSDEDSDATVELDSSDTEELLATVPEHTAATATAVESVPGGAATRAVPTPDHLPEVTHPPSEWHGENEHHPDESGHYSLLLRLVDDFLYITTDIGAARRFVTILHGKIPDYGCTVHQAKTQTSFDIKIGHDVGDQHAQSRIPKNYKNGSGFIPWCGLLIKTRTLEVQADYSRYVGEDFRLRDSFTVEASRAVGSTLRRRLYSFLRPKCHGVLLDTRINSLPTVWLNVYQAFLLAAIKFHCYTRALPQRHLNVQFFTRYVTPDAFTP